MGNQLPIFSKNLFQLRKCRKWTQEEASREIGCSLKEYRAWEKGDRYPMVTRLPDICKAFSVSSDFLLGLLPEKNHDLHFICDETGLSENAVEKLIENRSRIMFHREQGSEQQESFPNIVSSIIEHQRFLPFVYRLMQSRSADHKPVKTYQQKRQEEIENAHALLSTFGYSVLSPGEYNLIYLYDAKQEIAGIIDDLFRIDQSEDIELRN